MIEMDKNPNPDKMCAKVFVLDHMFIYGDAWHDLYTRIHASCPCMALATAKPGRPEKGGGWLNRPLKDSELLRMLRWVLVNVCGLTTEQSMDYSVSSLRKALPTICAARGCPQTDILDLGRWTGSWATRLYGLAKDMLDQWDRERRESGSVGPYTKCGAAGRIRGVIRQNLEAVRAMIEKYGLENMPTTGGWESATWHALHPGHSAERSRAEVWALPLPQQPQGEADVYLTEEWSDDESDEGC